MTNVINVRNALPKRTDRYFVDTNVWFWFTYCGSKEIATPNSPAKYQLKSYPDFIESVLDEGAKLFHCPLVFTELANIIERTEYEMYELDNSKITRKEFRSIPEQRSNVLSEIEMAWKTISSISNLVEINLNDESVARTIDVLKSTTLDPYDAIYYRMMTGCDISKIITDDGDFGSANIETIYTANYRMLSN